ncbi:unnamed protein product [Caenorhabditis auriculariae]|uniref:von Hippel-Lindau disease tumour suppressor beta domain-containing protein n=1 Tax=Caenorhabditis auriculariae TaxID=2777116 RepID=A0A8S1GQH8_9PELO|nr:unnamed protein product [Caenorhabditis auriculariae]
MVNEAGELETFPRVNSFPGGARVSLRMYNGTEETIEVFWMNFRGFPIFYARLFSHDHLTVTTYERHPWIFRRKKDGLALTVNKEKIYMPVPAPPLENPDPSTVNYTNIEISLPVLSLLELSSRKLMATVPRVVISQLVPKTIVEYLDDLYLEEARYTMLSALLINRHTRNVEDHERN